jgi:hypothetical protein
MMRIVIGFVTVLKLIMFAFVVFLAIGTKGHFYRRGLKMGVIRVSRVYRGMRPFIDSPLIG